MPQPRGLTESLSHRFPSVMRLLTGAAAQDEENNAGENGELGGDDDTTNENGGADDNAGQNDEAGNGGESDGGTNDDGGAGDDDGAGDEGGAAAETNVTSAHMLAAFERDANALVAAERSRCISVFTSDEGKRNPDGAAAILNDTNMPAASAIKLLGSVSVGRIGPRARLNADSSTRVDTGSGREAEADGAGASVKERQKAKRAERNKAAAAKGGVKPNRTVGAEG